MTALRGEFVREISLFRGLTHDEIQQLLDVSEEVRYSQGKPIFEEGDPGRALYIVIEGTVQITLAVPSISDTEVARLESRGVFGESSFFHASSHHATAVCLTPVRVIRLRYEKYRQLLEEDHLAALKLGANAAEVLAERLQQTDEWIERMLQVRSDAELTAKWKQFRRKLRGHHSSHAGGFSP